MSNSNVSEVTYNGSDAGLRIEYYDFKIYYELNYQNELY